MNTTRKLLCSTIGIVLFGTLSALRADGPSAPPTTPPPAPPAPPTAIEIHRNHDGMMPRLHPRIHMMKEFLGLNDDQVAKINVLYQNEAKQVEAIHQNTRNEIRELLTPEQRKKFDEVGRRPMPGPGVMQPGVARPVVVQPGIAKPVFTQTGAVQPGVVQPATAQPAGGK